MITLYHGSPDRVLHPEIRKPNRRLDFGSGFYLTSSLRQANDWTRRRGGGYVSQFAFDDDEARRALRVLTFASPTEAWLDFVMANRQRPDFHHDFDIVVGPVANDRVYTSFALYESGIIDKQILIAELKTYRLVDQYLFHTPASLAFLTYTSSTVADL